MSRLQTSLGVVCVLTVLAGAGCGSSKSSSSSSKSSTTASITKAEFLAKGNSLCSAANRKNQAATAKFKAAPTRTEIVDYVKKVFVPDVQAAIDGIRALGAPAGDQPKVTMFLDLAQADLNKAKANPLQLSPTLFADFAKPAHAYGLTDCARNA